MSKPSLPQRTIHAWVSGKVQGVNYRHATHEFAVRLGITGWVKNLPDGRVELVACGTHAAIADLIAWLHHGSWLAKVTNVQVEEGSVAIYEDFKIIR